MLMLELNERKTLLGWRLLELPNRVIIVKLVMSLLDGRWTIYCYIHACIQVIDDILDRPTGR